MNAPSRSAASGYVAGVLGMLAVGTFQAGLVTLLADWTKTASIHFAYLAVAFTGMNAGRFRLWQGLGLYGRDGFEMIRRLRPPYVEAMLSGRKEARWPKDPLRMLGAFGVVLSRALTRAWIMVSLVHLIAPAEGRRFGLLWVAFAVVEIIAIGLRSYRRGSLVLVGMSLPEMEAHFERVIGERTLDERV